MYKEKLREKPEKNKTKLRVKYYIICTTDQQSFTNFTVDTDILKPWLYSFYQFSISLPEEQ